MAASQADASSLPPAAQQDGGALLATTLAGARSLVLLQLLSRALTFGLNNALLRFASPEVFGTAAVQFDLLGATLLFLSREGVRGALLRSGGQPDEVPAAGGEHKAQDAQKQQSGITRQRQARQQQDLNLSLVPLPMFIALAAVLLPLYLRNSPSTTTGQPYFYPSLVLHLLGYLLELLSEPYHIRLQADLRLNVRVQAEGAAVIAKAVGTLAAVWALQGQSGALLGFGLGQLAYGVVLLGRFAAAFGKDAGRMWLPARVRVSPSEAASAYLDPTSASLAKAMTRQSVIKHFLTEGDRMIVSRISPLEDQGGYAVATNYGSLVARIVFQPLEESARLYFSKSLQSEGESAFERPAPSSDVAAAHKILTTLLRLSTHLLLLMPTFGRHYIPLALSLLLPASRWSSSRLQTPIAVLSIYTVYLPLMSLNGMLEAFFAATASPADLARQSTAMLGFSGAFVAAAFGLASAGLRPEAALTWANCVNMACRIAFAAQYARGWFGARGQPLGSKDVRPTAAVWAIVGLSWVPLTVSTARFAGGLGGLRSAVKHITVGAVVGVFNLGVCWIQERRSLGLAVRALKKRRE